MAETDLPVCAVTPEDVTETVLSEAQLLDLIDCLGSPDPKLRDEMAYTLLTDQLRDHRPETETLNTLKDRLIALSQQEDDAGFLQPFVLLILAEIIRTDTIDAWLTPEDRERITLIGADYLTNTEDYRAFSETEGWRHGIAHAADLLMQISRNGGIGMVEAIIIMEAVSTKVAPLGAPAYTHGEAERLARPILYLAQREMLTETIWSDYFARLQPNREESPHWDDPYAHEDTLAALHNTTAFARAVYVTADMSEYESLEPLKLGADMLLRFLP